MKYTKLGEEVFQRQKELTGEEFRLYAILRFHALPDTGVCSLTIHQIAERYGFDYEPVRLRIVALIRKKWLEDFPTGNILRPIVGGDK